MKRNYREEQKQGKSPNRGGNFRSSTRNEKQEWDDKRSHRKFFEDRDERPEKPGKPDFNKSENRGKNYERKYASSPRNHKDRGDERTGGEGKSPFNKYSQGSRERSES